MTTKRFFPIALIVAAGLARAAAAQSAQSDPNAIPASALIQLEAFQPTPPRYPTLEALKAGAARGEPKARTALALAYRNGDWDLKRDRVLAKRWGLKAAKAGDLGAMYWLSLDDLSSGSAKDRAEGRKWRERSFIALAHSPDNFASFPVGDLIFPICMSGYEGAPDAALVNRLRECDGEDPRRILRRADQADAAALTHLASAYHFGAPGWGWRRDRAKAQPWYRKAVAKGSTDAASLLGAILMEDGQTDPAKAREARPLLLTGAQAGSLQAMLDLRRMYAEGLGGPADKNEAQRWCEAAYDVVVKRPPANALVERPNCGG